MRCLTTLGLRKVQFTIVGQFQVVCVRSTLAAECSCRYGELLMIDRSAGCPFPLELARQVFPLVEVRVSVSVDAAQEPQRSPLALPVLCPPHFQNLIKVTERQITDVKRKKRKEKHSHTSRHALGADRLIVNHPWSLKHQSPPNPNPK